MAPTRTPSSSYNPPKIMGDFILIYPMPYLIYLRGTIDTLKEWS